MMEPMEASEREAVEAWRKSWPEREVARPDEPAAEACTHRRGTEASTPRPDEPAAEASTHRRGTEASTHRGAAKASTYCRAAKTPANASSTEAATPAHAGIRGRGRCHRAHEGDSGQRDYDLTHHWCFLPFVA
jgi:hypothetical protein